MKCAKFVALMAVLAMLAVPALLDVWGGGGASDYSDADSNVDDVNLSDLITGSSTGYWVVASGGQSSDCVLTNATGNPCNVVVDESAITSIGSGYRIILSGGTGTTFTIPADSSIVYPYELDEKCKIYIESNCTLKIEGKLDIGYFDDDEWYYSGHAIYLDPDSNVVIEGTVSGASFEIYTKRTHINMTDIMSTSSSDTPFTISRDGDKFVLSGDIVGVSGFDTNPYMFWSGQIVVDGVSLSNLEVQLNDNMDINIQLDTDFVCGLDVDFWINDKKSNIIEQLNSMFYAEKTSYVGFIIRDYYFNTIGYFAAEVTDFNVKQYSVLCLFEQDGIKEIKTQFEPNIIFVESNAVFDLTSINVVCEDGFKFEGWYYVNSEYVECKIVNPSQYVPGEFSTMLYAKAVYVGGNTPTPQPTPSDGSSDNTLTYVIAGIALVAILAIIGVAIARNRY